ncbi:hypothetical protein [Streptomyces sp. NBC_00842]|uniref:hypothetical protein n=1 Tax=Streptomyces sp. NBC_00842 TaxID=2975848 RepID=UPI003866FC55|nr:hypothetical protein OH821_44465 [Streptomyces sp. NBC_00842]
MSRRHPAQYYAVIIGRRLVKSARGAVPVFRPVRFPGAASRTGPDLRRGRPFRPGLRIKGVRVAPGVYELTWAPDGRATWSYGRELVRGAHHIVWRRIGTHSILTGP